jgi:phosphoribosylglycinamide formyltransferase-1
VHIVTEELDAGPIILQAAVPVEDDDTVDTLAARILQEEHRLLPRAVQLFAEGGVQIDGRRVRIRPAPLPLGRPAG